MDVPQLTSLAPSQVVFWSGAGISVDAPTSGPLGPSLMKQVLTNYFSPDLYTDLQKCYVDLGLADTTARPRLETVLDVAASIYGIDVLADALTDLATAPPNPHHAFFADHLAVGGQHITANFDTCIERSRAAVTSPPLHFHGALDASTSVAGLARLGARVSAIENGFPELLQEELDDVLGSPSTEAVVFVGYSGSDFFDAEPYLRDRGFPVLAGKLVVWLEFSTSPAPPRYAADATAGHLPDAHSAGADVIQLTGTLTDLREALARAWDFPASSAADPAAFPTRDRSLSPSVRDRATATGLLYARMGFRQRTVKYLRRHGPLSREEHELLADARWGTGRYRAAGRQWNQARIGASSDDQARRSERVVAVRWIRGQFLRAEREGWHALQQFATADADVSPATKLALLETYLRVVTHMRRSPDVRGRVDDERVREAAAGIERVRDEIRGHEGIHLRARVESARDNALRTGGHRDHATGFAESESLHGWLNYTQSELRARAESLLRDDPTAAVPVQEYRALRGRFVVIGAFGDVPRVSLLPGAEQAFAPWRVLYDWLRVDLTLWQKARFFGGFLVHWLRSRRRCWRMTTSMKTGTKASRPVRP